MHFSKEQLKYQRAKRRKLYGDVSETIHQARLKRVNWVEKLILKHIHRKNRLKPKDK